MLRLDEEEALSAGFRLGPPASPRVLPSSGGPKTPPLGYSIDKSRFIARPLARRYGKTGWRLVPRRRSNDLGGAAKRD